VLVSEAHAELCSRQIIEQDCGNTCARQQSYLAHCRVCAGVMTLELRNSSFCVFKWSDLHGAENDKLEALTGAPMGRDIFWLGEFLPDVCRVVEPSALLRGIP
jgi:hypothetical protein